MAAMLGWLMFLLAVLLACLAAAWRDWARCRATPVLRSGTIVDTPRGYAEVLCVTERQGVRAVLVRNSAVSVYLDAGEVERDGRGRWRQTLRGVAA
jgi:hypothetical protein